MTNLHLHLGAHKTATTLIQKALSTQRTELEASGTLVLLRSDIESLGERRPRRWRRGLLDVTDLRPVWDAVRARMTDHEHVVVSNEDLLGALRSFAREGRMYPDADAVLGPLLGAIQPQKVTTHFYVRRQDTFLEAVYLQSIRGGARHTFAEWTASLPTMALSWTEICDRLARLTEAAPRVHYYEDIRRGIRPFLKRFLQDTDCRIAPRFEFATRRQNRGYSQAALDVTLAANRVLRGRERIAFSEFVDRELSQHADQRPTLFRDSQRLALLESVAADNQTFHTRFAGRSDTSPYLPGHVATDSEGPGTLSPTVQT